MRDNVMDERDSDMLWDSVGERGAICPPPVEIWAALAVSVFAVSVSATDALAADALAADALAADALTADSTA